MSAEACLRIGVIIPTLDGARHLAVQLPVLKSQSGPAKTVVVIDSSSKDETVDIARSAGCQVEVIDRARFSHGGTRNRAARFAGDCEVLVFLTQDALPASSDFIERLIEPILAGRVAATYARQVPYEEAYPPEVFARQRNYPEVSQERGADDIRRLGLRAFFFSNVASAVRTADFVAVGGFPGDVIMNEDMELCAKLLTSGRRVGYVAEAVVRHSHNYRISQQFRRYFDIGAYLADSHLVGGRSLGEGLCFARDQVAWCWRQGAKAWIPRCLAESSAKFLAINLGRRHRWLPRWLKRHLSMHAFHWRRRSSGQ